MQEAELARDLARDEGVAEDARDEQYGASALEAPFSADSEPASAAWSHPDRVHAWEQYIAASKEQTASLVVSTAVKQWPATGMFSTSPLTVSSSEDTTDVVVGRANGAALLSAGGRSFAANAITRELLATSSPLHDTALEIERQKVLRDTADLVPSSPVARLSIASLASPLARAPGLAVTVASSAAPMATRPSSPVQLFDSSALFPTTAPPFSSASNSELRVILESALRDAQLNRDRTILSDAMGDSSSGVHRTTHARHRRGGVYLPRALPAQHEADQQSPDYDQVQRDIDARLAAIRAERLIADQQRLVRRQHAGAVRLQAIARGWLVRRSAALAALRTARERVRRRKALQVSAEAERQRVERERLAAVLVDSLPGRAAAEEVHAPLGSGEASLMKAEEQRRAAAREFEARLRAQLVEVQSAEAAAQRVDADARLRDEERRRRRELDLRAAELSFVDDLRVAVAEDAARLEFAAAAHVAASECRMAFAAHSAAQERQAMTFEDALSREAERRALALALELEERERLVREQETAKATMLAEAQARRRDAAAAASAAALAMHVCDSTGSTASPVLQVAQADAACAKAVYVLPVVQPLTSEPLAVANEPRAEDHPLELARAASVGGGRAVMLLRPGLPVSSVVDEARPVSVQRPNAATAAARSLQALWRGYCVRKDPSNPIVQRARARQRVRVRGVTRLQALCRGARVRAALRTALEAARFRDPDDFDYAPVDVGSFLGGLVPGDVDDYLSAERALAAGPRAAWNDPITPAQHHQPHPQLLLASQGRGSAAFETGGGGGRLARVRSHHTAADASALPTHGNAHTSDASAARPPMGPSSHPVSAGISGAPAAAAGALPPVRPRTGSGASPALLPLLPASAHGLPQLMRPPLLLRPDTSCSASWELASVRTADDEPAGRGAAPPPPTPTAVGIPRPPAMPRFDAAALLPLPRPPRQPPLPQPSPGSFVRGEHAGGAAAIKPQPPPAAPPADRRLAQLLRDPAALDLLLMQRRLRTQRGGEPLSRGGGGGAAGGLQPVQSLLPQRQAPPDAVPREYRGLARVPASAAPGVAAATALRSSALQRALGFQAGLHLP